MKFVFAGTTEFGIPTLEKLMKDHELLFVITQPDKPTGRKQELSPAPMKLWAQKKNIQVLQPVKISEIADQLSNSNCDILLVAAYGQIIPGKILSIPKCGSVNIHGSVLPKYRGASPIQMAILNGDSTTGITLIKMDEKMDHGPILAFKETSIDPNETFSQLYAKLSQLAAELTLEILPRFVVGQVQPKDQNHERATFTKMLSRADGRIDWTKPAHTIHNQIRALNPEPGTWTTLDGKVVKIIDAKLLPDTKIELPGKLYATPDGIAAKAVDRSLLLLKVQSEGGKPVSGKDYQNGLKNLSVKHFI